MQIGRPVSLLIRVLFILLSIASSAMAGAVDKSAPAVGMTAEGTVEQAYVARSWRETRVQPTEFCSTSRTKFDNAMAEDTYTFRSISIRPEDGLIVDPNVKTIGTLRACFGLTSDPSTFLFYAEGSLAGVSFVGRGDCLQSKADYPEAGTSFLRCHLHLTELPEGYVGGELTTSTISSRAALGGVSDPPGYIQPSVATIRLWRLRGSR